MIFIDVYSGYKGNSINGAMQDFIVLIMRKLKS